MFTLRFSEMIALDYSKKLSNTNGTKPFPTSSDDEDFHAQHPESTESDQNLKQNSKLSKDEDDEEEEEEESQNANDRSGDENADSERVKAFNVSWMTKTEHSKTVQIALF